MWGLLFLLFLFNGWRCYWALPQDLPVLTFTLEWLCLGNSTFYPNVVTFPTKDSACFQQACRENVLNLILNHCRAGNSSRGDTGHCWMLFLMEGYSPFPPLFLLFFHLAIIKVVHFPLQTSGIQKNSPFWGNPEIHQRKKRRSWTINVKTTPSSWRGRWSRRGRVSWAQKWEWGEKTGTATWGWLNFLRSVQETDPKPTAQGLAGCSTRWHGCMSGAGAVTHSREQSNPRLHRTSQSPSVATWTLRSCCWELFLPC